MAAHTCSSRNALGCSKEVAGCEQSMVHPILAYPTLSKQDIDTHLRAAEWKWHCSSGGLQDFIWLSANRHFQIRGWTWRTKWQGRNFVSELSRATAKRLLRLKTAVLLETWPQYSHHETSGRLDIISHDGFDVALVNCPTCFFGDCAQRSVSQFLEGGLGLWRYVPTWVR